MTITTADLLATVSAAPLDRRQSPRHKPAEPIETIICRGKGTLLDVSATGARIRHTGAVARGAHVRITFEWQRERFEGVGEVLASCVTGIGTDGTQFESRVRFLPLGPASSALLERLLGDLGEGDLRKWVANLHGWTEENEAPAPGDPAPVSQFIRCRYVNRHWQQRLTHDASIPLDGFTVAAGTAPSEIRALCRTFEQSDAEGRRLLQLMTSAVLEQRIERQAVT